MQYRLVLKGPAGFVVLDVEIDKEVQVGGGNENAVDALGNGVFVRHGDFVAAVPVERCKNAIVYRAGV